ncbi:MAG: hypothetical protein QM755_12995 [Luteolibacter sp.]
MDVTKAKDADLPALVASRSAVQRLEAQREIIKRGQKPAFAEGVYGIAKDPKQPLYARVAAIFTFKQLYGKGSTKALSDLVADTTVREFVLRAMADRLSELEGVPVQPYIDGLKDPNARVRLQALIGLSRLGAKDAAPAILAAAGTWPTDESKLEEGAHYRLPHTAVKALAKIGNAKACLAAVATPATRTIALRALQEMHSDEVVDGLIKIADGTKDPAILTGTLGALARLYNQEKPWDLTSWWNTRPDDRGPVLRAHRMERHSEGEAGDRAELHQDPGNRLPGVHRTARREPHPGQRPEARWPRPGRGGPRFHQPESRTGPDPARPPPRTPSVLGNSAMVPIRPC